MKPPPEITLPDRLKYLVQHCETSCVAGCCGIDAYDFAPLHVASYLAATRGEISDADVAEWEAELSKLEAVVSELSPNESGYICSVADMNQWFRRADFDYFIAELRLGIQVSPQLLELSKKLEYPTPSRYAFTPKSMPID
jgi:hypothetical protein